MWYYKNNVIESFDDIMTCWVEGGGNVLQQPFGFVYMMTDEYGKKYIGKKQFFFRRKLKPLKGRVRKRVKVTESDWLSYNGSSELVHEAIGGGMNFHKQILVLCPNKKLLTYHELQQIFANRALEKPDEFYNRSISRRFHSSDFQKISI